MNHQETTEILENNVSHVQYIYSIDSRGRRQPCGCAVGIVTNDDVDDPCTVSGWSMLSLEDEQDPNWHFTKHEARRLAVERAMFDENPFETARLVGRHKGSKELIRALRQTAGRAEITAFGRPDQR